MIVDSEQREFTQLHDDTDSSRCEHDPMEILSSVQQCMQLVLKRHPHIKLSAIGITNQRETTIAWDEKTGKPLHNAIVWHDGRTAQLVDEFSRKLAHKGGKDAFRAKTGLPLSTYFSSLKIKWLMDNCVAVQQAIARKTCLFGTVDSWLIWKLTGGASNDAKTRKHVTDVTNASRTQLMNLATLAWDEEICADFGIDSSLLPSIASSSQIYGHIAASNPCGGGIPIAACMGDQSAAMVGQHCFNAGQAKNTYGQ